MGRAEHGPGPHGRASPERAERESRRTLRDSEERFRFLYEDNPAMYFTVDAAGTILSVNRYGAEHLGYTVPELRGRPLLQVVHEADHEALRGQLAECGRTPGQVCRWEFRKVRKDGTVLWVRESVRPLRNADGELVFLMVCDDITDAKRGEAERERLLAQQHFLGDASRALAGSIDYETTLKIVARLAVPVLADFSVVDVLEEGGAFRRVAAAHADPQKEALAREMRRYPPDPTLEEHPVNRAIRMRRSEILPVGEEGIQASCRIPEHREVVCRLAPRSVLVVPLIARGRTVGAMQFMSLASESARDYGPEDVALAEELARRAAVAIDNARLYAEAERRAREERALREAVGAVSAAFSTEDVSRQIATSAVDATGADGAFVTWIHPGRRDVEVVALAGNVPPPIKGHGPYADSYTSRVVERREPILIDRLAEIEGPLREGPLVDTCPECSALVVPLMVERPIGALFLVREAGRPNFSPDEITRARTFGELAALALRKLQLLEESEARREELERISESRALLMRGFSHDVKNSLSAADGYAQLLAGGSLGELPGKQRESVQRIRRSIQTSIDLIHDLLDVARAEAGQIELEHVPTNIAEAAREAAQDIRPKATAAGLDVEIRAPDALLTETDPTRVRQILGNLVSNAVKYTPAGRVTVAADVRDGGREFRPGDWIAVSVTDTGPGIPEAKREQVFQEFTRLEREATQGAGVGLAISRRIARLLGGDITLRSEVGRGSTFTLWLPLAGDTQAEP
ncbi:MAG TPA: ATP-binding protein [Longimicrobiales bacterium]|nr:ATP-binding protein [Longimicrobiales bacterium]